MSKDKTSRRGRLSRQEIAIIVALIVLATGAGYYFVSSGGKPVGTFTTGSLSFSGLGNLTLPDGTVSSFIQGNTSTSISAQLDESFSLQLSTNAGSAGYEWNVSTSSGIRYVNYTVASTSTISGGPQVRDYNFEAVQPGNQSIVLQDMQQFAPHTVAATLTIQVEVVAEPTMLSYNFQVNGTGGALFVVLKNYGDSNLSLSGVSVDMIPVAQKSLSIGPGCTDFILGAECSITVTYGPPEGIPASGTAHSMELATYSGLEFTYSVTAGQTYEAECTYSSSC